MMPTKPISSVSMTIRSGDILSSSSSSSRLLLLVIQTYLCPLHHTAFTGQVYDRFFSSQDNTHAHTHTYAMFYSTNFPLPDSPYLASLEAAHKRLQAARASTSAAVAVSSSSGVSKRRTRGSRRRNFTTWSRAQRETKARKEADLRRQLAADGISPPPTQNVALPLKQEQRDQLLASENPLFCSRDVSAYEAFFGTGHIDDAERDLAAVDEVVEVFQRFLAAPPAVPDSNVGVSGIQGSGNMCPEVAV